jgi:hypothetical protein
MSAKKSFDSSLDTRSAMRLKFVSRPAHEPLPDRLSERWLPYDGVNCLRKYTALKCKIFTTTRACNRFSPIAVDNNQTNRTVRTVICGKYLPAHREVCSRSNRSHEDRSCRSTRLCVSRRVLFIAAVCKDSAAHSGKIGRGFYRGVRVAPALSEPLIALAAMAATAPHQSDPCYRCLRRLNISAWWFVEN